MIDPPSSSTVSFVVGSTLTLSCTSRGSPPDTFTWRKDSGPTVQSTNITTVTHTDTTAVFRTDYSINSVTTSDSGTYTCTVTNPIGSDSRTISVAISKFSDQSCLLKFMEILTYIQEFLFKCTICVCANVCAYW